MVECLLTYLVNPAHLLLVLRHLCHTNHRSDLPPHYILNHRRLWLTPDTRETVTRLHQRLPILQTRRYHHRAHRKSAELGTLDNLYVEISFLSSHQIFQVIILIVFPIYPFRSPTMTITIVRPGPIVPIKKLTPPRKYTNDGDVSPIDEMPDISKLDFNRPASRTGKHTTSIPVLRREAKRNQVAAAAASFVGRKGEEPKGRISKNPKFDPYTGEITTSERGKPQSAKPGEFALPGVSNVHSGTGLHLGNETTISGAQKQHTSFSDRVRKFKGGAPPERPEWKGATGRIAIPPPVLDDPNVKPLNIPRKSSRRVTSPVSDFHSQTSSPITVVRGDDDEAYPISPTMQSPDPAIRTVVKGHRATPSEVDIKPDFVTVSQPAASKTLARAITPPEVIFQNSESVGKIERDFQEALKENFPPQPPPQEQYYQPPSRFSVTTYAPSEARSSPRPSTDTYDRPPLPTQTPPQSYTFQQISPMVDRRRPKVDESPKSNSSKLLTRKAVPGSPVFISMSTSRPISKRTSSLSTTKNLPMSPAEAQSHDLVTALQAQLDDLAHRRMNVTRSIRQMTELMPQDRVLMTDAVRVKRENEKLMIERLKVEEADIRREEHEVGLRLHRAWKRRDNMAEFEPTGLWVRRVGSH